MSVLSPNSVKAAPTSESGAEVINPSPPRFDRHVALLNGILRYVPDGITIARAPDVKIEHVSAYGLQKIHRTETEVGGITGEKHPQAWQVFDRFGKRQLAADELPLTRAIKFGEIVENEFLTLKLPDGELLPILCNAGPIRDELGTITDGIIVWRDVSELVKLEEARELLLREMDHRVKNAYALMSSIIGLAAKHASSVSDFAEAMQCRIAALAKAHSVIKCVFASETPQEKTLFRNLAMELLRPHLDNPGRLLITGPDSKVDSKKAGTVALILHELAANATKYGALSNGAGTISIALAEEGRSIVIEWLERDGPMIRTAPQHLGFGSQLIQNTLRAMGGTAHFDWQPQGLRVQLSLPL